MLKQLRIKFVAVTMSLIAVLLCLLTLMLFLFTAISLDKDVTIKMQSVSESIGRYGFPMDRPFFDDRLHYFILSQNMRGELVAIGTESFERLTDADLNALYNIAMDSESISENIIKYELKYHHVVGKPGTIVFGDISQELAILRALAHNCVLIVFIAMVLFAVLAKTLAKWIMKPVEAAWEQQKQFVADASHELKTPLTVITTNTEMLASPDYSFAEKERFLQNTTEMTKRMRFLVESMLDMARVDNGVVQSAMEQLDYSQLNEQCVLPFEPLFFESGRILTASIAPNIHLKGSPTHLAQVTDILLDNAMKYSPPDSEVRLTLRCQNKHALLCVDSCGEELSKDMLENIFRRFYTVDRARTGGSCGLGLPIAKGIVEEHKGKIWAESSNGHNRFYVKLPL